MKKLSWRLTLAAACGALTLLSTPTPAVAAEERPAVPGDRPERLERQVKEMAQRQEQLMRRLEAAQQQPQAPMGAPMRENLRQRLAARGGPMMDRLERVPGAPALPAPPAPAVAPACPMKGCKAIKDLVGLFMLIAFVSNILIAIWIFSDIRRRGEGSGIFVALALLAGVPTAIIYAIVRIGDRKA